MEKPKLKHLDKNTKYIISTDLDGCFLAHYNSGMNIDNFRAVKAIKESNNYFIIATGRSWWWTKMFYDQLDLSTPSIHFSGAQVHNGKPNKDVNAEIEIYRQKIERQFVLDLVNKFDMLHKTIDFVVSGRKFIAHFQERNNINDLFFNPYELILNMKPEYSSDEFLEEVRKFVEPRYSLRVWRASTSSNNTDLVIAPRGATKASGLQFIAKQLGIPQEHVIYFGDNVNDIEALKWAGYSYAPSNATQDAKDAADEVLDKSNDEGGVADKILELIYG